MDRFLQNLEVLSFIWFTAQLGELYTHFKDLTQAPPRASFTWRTIACTTFISHRYQVPMGNSWLLPSLDGHLSTELTRSRQSTCVSPERHWRRVGERIHSVGTVGITQMTVNYSCSYIFVRCPSWWRHSAGRALSGCPRWHSTCFRHVYKGRFTWSRRCGKECPALHKPVVIKRVFLWQLRINSAGVYITKGIYATTMGDLDDITFSGLMFEGRLNCKCFECYILVPNYPPAMYLYQVSYYSCVETQAGISMVIPIWIPGLVLFRPKRICLNRN